MKGAKREPIVPPGLSARLRFLEKITADARDALIIADDAHRIILFSKAATDLFGYDPDEVVGRDLALLMDEPHRSAHARYLAEYRQSGKGRIIGIGPREVPARHKSGAAVPIEISVSEIRWNGRLYFAGICRDITERLRRERELREAKDRLGAQVAMIQAANRQLEIKQREACELAENLAKARDEALKAERAKSEFLATMSHEIRTPLNGAIGFAQVLAKSQLSPEQREHLDLIGECCQQLLALVNQVLDLARIEAGLMTIDARKTDLSEFLQSVGNHWRRRAEAKGLGFKLVVSSDLPAVAELDDGRLRQVLDNLLGNAVKFTERGEIALEVGLVPGTSGELDLRFAVRDTGPGIASENLERIFLPFVQSDSSITRRFGGTGLGLAICKKLTALMGGAVGVASEPGKGSLFWMTCPCAPESMASGRPSDAEAPEEGVFLPLKVLVAEDNEINQKVMATILTQLGHRPAIARNGHEAIALLETAPFDVILMDLHMPGLDGAAASRALRQRRDRLRDIPIIGVTASVLERDQKACLDAGMTAVLTKPIEVAALARALAPFVRRLLPEPLAAAAPAGTGAARNHAVQAA